MKKVDIVNRIAAEADITKIKAGEIFDIAVTAMKEALVNGESVDFYGFFKMTRAVKPERECRNPQTGETLIVPEHYVPKCKFSDAFKKEVKAE